MAGFQPEFKRFIRFRLNHHRSVKRHELAPASPCQHHPWVSDIGDVHACLNETPPGLGQRQPRPKPTRWDLEPVTGQIVDPELDVDGVAKGVGLLLCPRLEPGGAGLTERVRLIRPERAADHAKIWESEPE